MPEEKETLNPEETTETSSPELDSNVNIDAGDSEETNEESKEVSNEESKEVRNDESKEAEVDAGKPEVEETKKSGNWWEGLPVDYQNDPDVIKYKSLEEYVKGNREVRKLIGKDKIVVPSDKSPQEDWDKFYQKLGRPENSVDYVAPELPEGSPEALKMKEENMELIKDRAHKMGYTKKQFAESLALINEINLTSYNQELEKAQKLKETTMTTLRQEWGAATDTKVDGAQKVINTFFGDKKMHKAFEVLSSDEGFVRGMAQIAENIGEDKIAGKARETMTPKEAQTKIDAIMAGNAPESKAFFSDTNPEHEAVKDMVTNLYRMAEAGK
ncbi:MAG: hypothetical protein U9O94_08730 [Nanoarchaeota archaeon]|nr:hypothetical protein [Nanoarchaeota archaeon]